MTLVDEVTTGRVGMPLSAFLAAQEDQPFELLDGERVDRMPNVFGHAWYIRFLFRVMDAFVTQHKLGEVFTELTYAQLEGETWVRGARIPDLAFYVHTRIEAFKAAHSDWRTRPLHIAPDLTIEVLSPTERAVDVTRKWRVDMGSGVRALWAVDIENEVVTVYRGDQARLLTRGDVLADEELLPAFRLPLAELFQKEDAS